MKKKLYTCWNIFYMRNYIPMKNMIDINGFNSKKEIIIKNINASNLLDLVHIIIYGYNSNITLENINFQKLTSIENMFNRGSYTNGRISLININAPEVKQ